MNAICLVIDRLHAGYVGAYGNSWIETPWLNQLASQGFVFDHARIDSPRLEALYRSYWQGGHALCSAPPPEDRRTLAAVLREAGVATALMTDERQVAEHPLAVDFDDVLPLDPPWQARTAAHVEQTHLGRCFAEAISWLRAAEEPFLFWCHLAGLATAWDAPPEFRRRYWEEGDPDPSDSAEVPERMLPRNYDPDQLLGIVQAYAGQVSLLDTCLGALLESLDEMPIASQPLLVVTSARGFPLGEHRRIGPCGEPLYGELVHVPWLMRFPDRLSATARSQALVEPADLWATLLDWWRIEPPPGSPSGASLMPIVREEVRTLRDRLCIAGGPAESAICTPAWYLRMAAEPELFAKPEDRWEANNVTDRCREVVECLQDAFEQYRQALQSGRVSDLPPLSEVLLSGLE